MIQGKSILAIIPARGGSKGIPRKNICMLAGKPLVAWTIGEAKKSKYIDRLILSSEDEGIIKVAEEWGCEVPFIRPAELARDDTPGIEPVLHALNTLKEKYDYVVLLQPTSPLRLVADIDGCIETCINTNAPACITVTETSQHPSWMYRIDKSGCLISVLKKEKEVFCRQNLDVVYIMNGAVYMAEINWLTKQRSFYSELTKAYVMPKDRKIDIDEKIDLEVCEMLIRKTEL